MHPSLQKLFSELETQRKRTVESVKTFSHEQLHKTPFPGKWSAAQILNHLVTAEQLSLRYMQKKIQGIKEVPDSGLWEEVKINLLKISQRLPGLKFKAPKGVVENMTQYPDLTTLVAEWDNVRSELKSLLEKIPDDLINRKIYRHTIAGYLNAKHSLLFFREHITHHTPQIKKVLNIR